MVPRIITVGVSGADENDMAKINSAIATKDVGTIKAVAGALKAAKTADSAESSEAAYQMANDAINAQVEAEAQPEEDAESIATD